MSDDTYEGWTNRATWLVNLWVNNDYDTYRLLGVYNVSDAEDCEYFVRNRLSDSVRDSILSDMAEYWTLDDVNWEEIYEAWSEE